MPRKRKRRFVFRPVDEPESEAEVVMRHLFTATIHVLFVVCILFVLSPLVTFLLGYDEAAFILLLAVLLTGPVSLFILKHFRELGVKKWWEAVVFLSRHRVMRGVVLCVLNSVIFLWIGLQTLIPLLWLIDAYVLVSFFVFLFLQRRSLRHRLATCGMFGPLILNVFLCLNFFASHDPVQETYVVQWNQERVGFRTHGTTQRSTLVTLNNDAYADYPGIRVFGDFSSISNLSKITYTFETGLFGIRVMKSYDFY